MNPYIKKYAMNFGIIAAVISILYSLIAYLVDQSLFVNLVAGVVMMVIGFVLYIMSPLRVKRDQGGYITFRDAVTSFVLTFIIAGITGVIWNLLLFNVIDPELQSTVQEMTIEKSVQMMERFGAPEESIDQSIAQMEETNNYSLGNQVKGFFMMLLFMTIVGLIVAAIIKKDPPLVDEHIESETE
jgi:hypothetical protein